MVLLCQVLVGRMLMHDGVGECENRPEFLTLHRKPVDKLLLLPTKSIFRQALLIVILPLCSVLLLQLLHLLEGLFGLGSPVVQNEGELCFAGREKEPLSASLSLFCNLSAYERLFTAVVSSSLWEGKI